MARCPLSRLRSGRQSPLPVVSQYAAENDRPGRSPGISKITTVPDRNRDQKISGRARRPDVGLYAAYAETGQQAFSTSVSVFSAGYAMDTPIALSYGRRQPGH